MKQYLKATIKEEIERGMVLKNKIPHPLDYPGLTTLAERCERIIDEATEQLEYLLSQVDQEQNDFRQVMRGFRDCVRRIELVECYGISAVFHQTPELIYLNKLIYKIHKEINLPIVPPSVACISTSYYCFQYFIDIIFVPLGESEFLFHLPDMFHELGHAVLYKKENNPKLKDLRTEYGEVVVCLTDYYQKILVEKIRQRGPDETKIIISNVHMQWKENWLDEFFADLFALYTLGPAYANAHLHLVTKRSNDIFEFSKKTNQTHPSDESRMRMLLLGLNKIGFSEEAKELCSKWKKMHAQAPPPIVEYKYAYPDDLMDIIATKFLSGLTRSGFNICTPERLNKAEHESVIKILNDSWEFFWKNPDDFREWEKIKILELKRIQ